MEYATKLVYKENITEERVLRCRKCYSVVLSYESYPMYGKCPCCGAVGQLQNVERGE